MGGGALVRCLVAAFLASVEALSLRVCVVAEGGVSSPNDPSMKQADITTDAELHGYDVELRSKILTQHMALPYSVTVYPTYGALNVACRLGVCDICWATFFLVGTRDRCLPDENMCRDINMPRFEEGVATDWDQHRGPSFDWTPYRCCIDHSPGHMTGMLNQIGVLEHRVNKPDFVMAFFDVIFDPFFANFLCFLFLWITVAAHAIWAAERQRNVSEFPRAYLDGIDDAVWWSCVTVTTVGYGDKSPRSPLGRLVAIVWMIFGVSMCSILTGHISTRFYDLKKPAQLTDASELAGLRVCSYASSYLKHWMEGIDFKERWTRDNMDMCGVLMEAGKVDAVVIERSIGAYYRKNTPWCAEQNVVISPPVAEQRMGLLYPEASVRRDLSSLTAHGMDYKTAIDTELMDYIGSADQLRLEAGWFPTTVVDSGPEQLVWEIVAPAIALVSVYLAIQVARSFRSLPVAPSSMRVLATTGTGARSIA